METVGKENKEKFDNKPETGINMPKTYYEAMKNDQQKGHKKGKGASTVFGKEAQYEWEINNVLILTFIWLLNKYKNIIIQNELSIDIWFLPLSL